jgi:hypothetical protein
MERVIAGMTDAELRDEYFRLLAESPPNRCRTSRVRDEMKHRDLIIELGAKKATSEVEEDVIVLKGAREWLESVLTNRVAYELHLAALGVEGKPKSVNVDIDRIELAKTIVSALLEVELASDAVLKALAQYQGKSAGTLMIPSVIIDGAENTPERDAFMEELHEAMRKPLDEAYGQFQWS